MEDSFESCTIAVLNTISNLSRRTRFYTKCGAEYKIINFLGVYYQTLGASPILFGLVLLVGVPYLLFFLKHLCEQHIAHLIPELANKMGMNKHLSAVILVSFVISFNNFLYIFHSEETDHKVECLESGFILFSVFVSIACVLPLCVLRSSEVKVRVNKANMNVELGMIFLALAYICLYAFLGWADQLRREVLAVRSACAVRGLPGQRAGPKPQGAALHR